MAKNEVRELTDTELREIRLLKVKVNDLDSAASSLRELALLLRHSFGYYNEKSWILFSMSDQYREDIKNIKSQIEAIKNKPNDEVKQIESNVLVTSQDEDSYRFDLDL